MTAASVSDGNKVEIHAGSASGTLAGTCDIKNTGNWKSYEDNTCEVTGLSGIVDQLFLVFKGLKDSTMGLIEWEFIGEGGGSTTSQFPHDSILAKVPGKIETENYDDGGARRAYSDSDADNQGDANVRTTEGVDLVAGGTGIAVGYTVAGEWMEYTIEATEDGEFPITAYASSGAENSSFIFELDGKPFGDTVKVTKTGEDWSVYQEFSAGKGVITKGLHEIRVTITGSNVNIDWFAIGDVKQTDSTGVNNDTTAVEPGGDKTTLNRYNIDFEYHKVSQIFKVFNADGSMLGAVSARDIHEACRLWKMQHQYSRGVNFVRDNKGKVVPINLR